MIPIEAIYKIPNIQTAFFIYQVCEEDEKRFDRSDDRDLQEYLSNVLKHKEREREREKRWKIIKMSENEFFSFLKNHNLSLGIDCNIEYYSRENFDLLSINLSNNLEENSQNQKVLSKIDERNVINIFI